MILHVRLSNGDRRLDAGKSDDDAPAQASTNVHCSSSVTAIGASSSASPMMMLEVHAATSVRCSSVSSVRTEAAQCRISGVIKTSHSRGEASAPGASRSI
jgi:hypothetical protein